MIVPPSCILFAFPSWKWSYHFRLVFSLFSLHFRLENDRTTVLYSLCISVLKMIVPPSCILFAFPSWKWSYHRLVFSLHFRLENDRTTVLYSLCISVLKMIVPPSCILFAFPSWKWSYHRLVFSLHNSTGRSVTISFIFRWSWRCCLELESQPFVPVWIGMAVRKIRFSQDLFFPIHAVPRYHRSYNQSNLW